MIIKSKTKKLKLEFKSLENDLLKTYKQICDIYQKKEHLDVLELRNEIERLLEVADISIINEISGYDEYFTTSIGSSNKVNRSAFVDKNGNCIVNGFREKISD